jgi:adenylosuccinate lyase
MNQSEKPATVGETAASWEQRLRAHPELLPQIAALLDIIELKGVETATADQAETGVRAAVQQLGKNVLSAWAAQRQQQLVAQRQAAAAAVQHHTQKNSPGTPLSAPSR